MWKASKFQWEAEAENNGNNYFLLLFWGTLWHGQNSHPSQMLWSSQPTMSHTVNLFSAAENTKAQSSQASCLRSHSELGKGLAMGERKEASDAPQTCSQETCSALYPQQLTAQQLKVKQPQPSMGPMPRPICTALN